MDSIAEAGKVRVLEELVNFTARFSDDELKRDMELTCARCHGVVCDIEDGDPLSVLVRTAMNHTCDANRSSDHDR